MSGHEHRPIPMFDSDDRVGSSVMMTFGNIRESGCGNEEDETFDPLPKKGKGSFALTKSAVSLSHLM